MHLHNLAQLALDRELETRQALERLYQLRDRQPDAKPAPKPRPSASAWVWSWLRRELAGQLCS